MLRHTFIAATAALTLWSGAAFPGPSAMTPEEARHLISRTGFGASPDEIATMTGRSYAEGVDMILGTIRTDPVTPRPAWVDSWDYPAEQIWTLGQTKVELFFTNRWLEITELGAWWMAEMVATPSPLTERLVLFWHDHFATSFEAVENAQWLSRQNQFFRDNAAGNFADLAEGILRDPAMLVYLSNSENFADAPNENLGREFLELFTLGEMRGYTQEDVRAAARALTGHGIAEHGAPIYAFDPEVHDAGAKSLFGQTGNFDAADLAQLTLAHPDFGPFIVEKLWLEFVSDVPDPVEVDRLAALWRENDLALQPLLRAMFLTDAFWDRRNRGRLVKSPVEMLVGTARSLGQPIDDARQLVWAASENGQTLFMPPNVGGWPRGVDWINDANASGRATVLTYLLSEAEDYDPPTAAMMQMTADSPTVADVAPQDLRVGQTFIPYVEDGEDNLGVLIILFDVGFAGNTWRSVPIWLAHDPDEDFAGLYINTADCQPDCFASLPVSDDDPAWLKFETWDGLLAENAPLAAEDTALLGALARHLPDLVRSTRDQMVWIADPEYGETAAEIRPVIKAAQAMARSTRDVLGRSSAKLVIALSDPNALGLAGLDRVGDEDDLDDYVTAREDASRIAAVPPVVYATARDWINALPGTTPESKRAAQALLAVPRQTQGQRQEMVVGDPQALLRSLILSPEFQVN